MAPNRIAVYLTALAALAGGLAPVVADLDLSSTVGIVAGLASITAAVNKWLSGWQAYESRMPVELPDSLHVQIVPRHEGSD
jgi:hypothetical protein